MNLTIFILLVWLVMIVFRHPPADNILAEMYDIYNKNVYPFHSTIGASERAYVDSIVSKYDYNKEFNKSVDVSPYSFSISIDKETNAVNLTRVNIGSVETDISQPMKRLLNDLKIRDVQCTQGFLFYGVGWDHDDSIIKIYTILKNKTKIECYVYKVSRDATHEIVETKFHTKKTYDVGKRDTIMYKNGKQIKQRNVVRALPTRMKNPIANKWITKMTKLNFVFDTHSDYDGKINLYFD